ncbi:MAG TPA: hypothetical protein VK550_17905 [Polyangiaceae bacterium]|jgi:hypothetical protein|nr:hypothetical protein [Polyangiaceae bacterium]
MSAEVTWQGGGTAVIDVIDNDRVELVSTRAFAPGSRPEATVVTGGQPIWLKVHGSRRQEDGAFRVKGRLLNVRRELLDALKDVVQVSNGGRRSTS